jgi:hypothetical protein
MNGWSFDKTSKCINHSRFIGGPCKLSMEEVFIFLLDLKRILNKKKTLNN